MGRWLVVCLLAPPAIEIRYLIEQLDDLDLPAYATRQPIFKSRSGAFVPSNICAVPSQLSFAFAVQYDAACGLRGTSDIMFTDYPPQESEASLSRRTEPYLTPAKHSRLAANPLVTPPWLQQQ
ncbi:uncharacterized protein TrAFT101_006755 [Trichoderma asperellum]|uniref:uncharacterized protein n=1 Tax=Trichoderma asperellum TaxID=101201 RepID=UPI0033321CAC|nr:hypothetical protein TrAFT101_006755 [Trichoderma asperellum]